MRLTGQYKSISLLLAFMFLQAGETRDFRYVRSILVAGPGPSCAVLDAAVLAHSSGAMKDVRVLSEGRELAYAVAVNGTMQIENDTAGILNMRERAGSTEFDLTMPPRPYTQISFRLVGADFVAKATLTGSDELPALHPVALGTYSMFDMRSRGLSRDTTLDLPESTYRFVHVKLQGRGFQVQGVEIPPSREGQTLFTPVAETRALERRGSEVVAMFRLPARVPVERVEVRLDPHFSGNFSRTLRVSALADGRGSPAEQIAGTIIRVRTGAISVDQEGFPASLGANLQSDATVEVAMENEPGPAIPITSVALMMRQRTLCLDAPGTPVDLFYGNPQGTSPLVRYETQARYRLARLGPERVNPEFREPGALTGQRSGSKRRMWQGAILLLLAGGLIAWARGKNRRHRSPGGFEGPS